MRFFKIYRKKKMKDPVRTLRIDGVKTTLTPKPDDAELAAQALLESMTEEGRGKKALGRRTLATNGTQEEEKEKQNYPRTSAPSHLRTPDRPTPSPSPKGRGVNRKHADGTPEYYQDLSEKIRIAHEHDRRMAMRYVAYVEAQLKKEDGRRQMEDGSAVANSTLYTLNSTLSDLERGLYAHQDAIEREGGELKRRWQKCLATVIMLEMQRTYTD